MAGRTYANGAVRSVIPEISAELALAAYDIVEFTLAGIESHASATAPIGLTGNLAGSQGHDSRQLVNVGAEGEATSGADYSAYVNYGTGQAGAASVVPGRGEEVAYSAGWKGMRANPFFSQAAVDAEEEWDKAWRALETRLPRL